MESSVALLYSSWKASWKYSLRQARFKGMLIFDRPRNALDLQS